MIERTIQLALVHRVVFTRGAFATGNQTLVELLRAPARLSRVMVVVDSGVALSNPDLVAQIGAYFGSQDGVLELETRVFFSSRIWTQGNPSSVHTVFE